MGNERIDGFGGALQNLANIPAIWEMYGPEGAKELYPQIVHSLQQKVYDTIIREDDQSLLLLDTIIAVESLASTPLNTAEDLPKIQQHMDKLLHIQKTYDETRGYSNPINYKKE